MFLTIFLSASWNEFAKHCSHPVAYKQSYGFCCLYYVLCALCKSEQGLTAAAVWMELLYVDRNG